MLYRMGRANCELGHYTEAELLLQACKAIRRSMQLDPCADVHGWLGVCLKSLGTYEDAEEFLRTSHKIYREMYGNEHKLTVRGVSRLANLYEAWNLPGKAEACRIRVVSFR